MLIRLSTATILICLILYTNKVTGFKPVTEWSGQVSYLRQWGRR